MIQATDVVCRYGETVAVDGASLEVADGDCVLVVGPNGSGKTTLVRTFNGLVDPDSGTITVNGTPVRADLVAARTAVGMVFQDPRDQLVAATVGADVAFGPENLGLSRAEIDRRVTAALEAVALGERDGKPDGEERLENRRFEDRRIEELSGGERERVAIAGALAMEPEHLVLDEPFTGLDEPARQSVLARLRQLKRDGTSLIIVTHDLRDLVELADRIVALSDGRVVRSGPASAVRQELDGVGVRVPMMGRDTRRQEHAPRDREHNRDD